MESARRVILSIPLNIEDIDRIEEGVCWEDIRFEEYELSTTDYDNLFSLFESFDAPFGIIIDEYEEEIIGAQHIKTAIEMTRRFAQRKSLGVKASADKLLTALERARDLGRQIVISC